MKSTDSKTQNSHSLGKRIRSSHTSYFMMAPFAALFLVFTVIPVFTAVVLSFTSFNMVQFPTFVGLENYSRMFLEDEIFILAIKNTLIFAFITGPVGYVLSFVFAWCINEFNPRVRSILTLIFYAPTLAGNVYFVWTYIFSGDQYGFVNNYLMSWGLLNEPIQWLTDTNYNLMVVIIVVIWLSMGSGFLAFVAGLQNIDRQYYEAAAIDGIRNRWQELRHVTLPQMGPQLLFGAVMSISSSFAVGYQCSALTGFPSTDYSTHTLLLHMLDFGTIRYEMGYASTVAVFLFGLMLLSWMAVNKLLRKISGD
jgi:multiple sugar transport system permease protein